MKNKLYLFTLIITLAISVFSCKQNTANSNKEDKVVVEKKENISVDRNMGAHIVAQHMTKILKDTLGVVVYELTMKPGDTLPWHEHPYHTSYIIEGGTLELIFKNSRKIKEFPTGKVGFGPAFGDIAINVGETTVKVLMHELYSLETNN